MIEYPKGFGLTVITPFSGLFQSTTKITATKPQVTMHPTPNEEEQSKAESNVTDQQEDKQTPVEPNPKHFDIPT